MFGYMNYATFMQIWCSRNVPWLQDVENVPFYQEWQPGR